MRRRVPNDRPSVTHEPLGETVRAHSVDRVPPVRVPIRHVGAATRLMLDAHRRTPSMPWHWSVTGATTVAATVAGATYTNEAGDAVAIVWRITPGGVLRASLRLAFAVTALPLLAAALTRSVAAVAIVLVAEIAVAAAFATIYEVSLRRARRRWLSREGNEKPRPECRPRMVRWGHLVGGGVAAANPHAADAMCQAIAEQSDLPIYLVAVSRFHARLYRRFGFEPVGPSFYGEVPMRREAGA